MVAASLLFYVARFRRIHLEAESIAVAWIMGRKSSMKSFCFRDPVYIEAVFCLSRLSSVRDGEIWGNS